MRHFLVIPSLFDTIVEVWIWEIKARSCSRILNSPMKVKYLDTSIFLSLCEFKSKHLMGSVDFGSISDSLCVHDEH